MPKFINNVKTTMAKHSPEILTGIGIAGMITTTVLAVKATPKALRLIEEEKERQYREICTGERESDEFKTLDAVKVAWKCYIPAAATGIASIACLIFASSVNSRRNAALATAYKLSETAFTEYREKVIESIGEKKEKNIRDKVHKERIEKNPSSKSEIIITEMGNTLCYDYNTGRYFKSDIDKIKKAVNEINRRMLIDNYISVNDFYEEIGLDRIREGDRMGWKISDGLIELDFSTQLSDNGTPCLVISFVSAPKYDFDKFF